MMREENWERLFRHSSNIVVTEKCFSDLVEEQLEKMRRSVTYILRKSHVPLCDVEDLINDTLISTFDVISTNNNFKFDNLKGYLVISVIHKTLNYIRQFNKHNHLPFEDVEEKQFSDGLIDHSRRLEIKLIYKRIFQQLSDEEKTIWDLLVMGYDRKDIAFVLGIPMSSVYVKVHRFKGKVSRLRKELNW